MRNILPVVVALLYISAGLYAQDRPEFHVARTTEPPGIDGDLNDDAWQREPLPLSDWTAYNPLRGGRMEQRTDVRIAHDDRYIYFAFQCFDDQPERIRT